MRGNLRNTVTLAALTVSMACAAQAQSNAPNPPQPDLTAHVEPQPPGTDKGTAPPAASSISKQELKPTVEQQIEALKNRIDELESEVKQAKAATLADSNDTAALKAAEKALVAGSGAVSTSAGVTPSSTGFSSSTAGQEPAPAAASAPAPKEISAQTTTKGEPFEGDWTWLNSNGHASDSPMATKYFTPEFRADANYTLDYNHPKDDSLGGSTETFRSDEWQLEQISIGGDIHINNVRGRILTMDGLFATTTPRNDATPSRGQWDLSNAYKYVSRSMGRLSLGMWLTASISMPAFLFLT